MRKLLIISILLLPAILHAQGWTLKTKYRSDSCFLCVIGRHTHRAVVPYTIAQDSLRKKISFIFKDSTASDTVVIKYDMVERWPDAPEKNCIYYRTGGAGNVIYYPGTKPKVVVMLHKPGPGAFHYEFYN